MTTTKYPRCIKHEEYTYQNKPAILDTAELSPGNYETMLMRPDGKEIASITAPDEATALHDFQHFRKQWPADDDAKVLPPLTGKYAKLRDDLRSVYKIGLDAAAQVHDGGTCNMDAPAVALPRWNAAKVEQACKEAGGGCFKWSVFNRFVICFPIPGQAYKIETAAEAMTKALDEMGYDAMTYCQMD